jgi:hypothetical protein
MNAIDLIKLNQADDMTGLIEENQNVAPELSLAPAFTIPGTSFTTCIRKNYPEGSFKPLGGGVQPGSQDFENKIVNVFGYANPLQEKKDRAASYRRGTAAWLSLAASGAVQGAFQKIGRAFYYGARAFGGGTDACPGLLDLYLAASKTIDATGTTVDTASSVWFIKWGNQEDGNVSFVFGNDRTLTLREWMLQQVVTDATVTPPKLADAWTNELAAGVGIQLNNVHAAVRIKKLTEDSGKGLTDALGYRALELFPVGWTPDVAIMTKRSRRQLQESRSALGNVAYTGGAVAPIPTDLAGIPIVVTDSILNTEALTL